MLRLDMDRLDVRAVVLGYEPFVFELVLVLLLLLFVVSFELVDEDVSFVLDFTCALELTFETSLNISLTLLDAVALVGEHLASVALAFVALLLLLLLLDVLARVVSSGLLMATSIIP